MRGDGWGGRERRHSAGRWACALPASTPRLSPCPPPALPAGSGNIGRWNVGTGERQQQIARVCVGWVGKWRGGGSGRRVQVCQRASQWAWHALPPNTLHSPLAPSTPPMPGNIGGNNTGDLNVGCKNRGTGNRGSCLIGDGKANNVFKVCEAGTPTKLAHLPSCLSARRLAARSGPPARSHSQTLSAPPLPLTPPLAPALRAAPPSLAPPCPHPLAPLASTTLALARRPGSRAGARLELDEGGGLGGRLGPWASCCAARPRHPCCVEAGRGQWQQRAPSAPKPIHPWATHPPTHPPTNPCCFHYQSQ